MFGYDFRSIGWRRVDSELMGQRRHGCDGAVGCTGRHHGPRGKGALQTRAARLSPHPANGRQYFRYQRKGKSPIASPHCSSFSMFIRIRNSKRRFGRRAVMKLWFVFQACQLPMMEYLAERMCSLCYDRAWYAKMGGCIAIKFMFEKMDLRWVYGHLFLFVKAQLFVMMDLTGEVRYLFNDSVFNLV